MNNIEAQSKAAGWLFRYEARGIQRYVTTTERLEEIAGASVLVESLKNHGNELAKGFGGCVLTDPAGSATIRFEDETGLQRFAEWWPMVAARVAPGLPMIQAAVDLSVHDLPLHVLRTKLDEAYQRQDPDLPEAGPLIQRSGRSGRPAVKRGRRRGKKDMRDVATQQKIRMLKHQQESGQDEELGKRFLGQIKTNERPFLLRTEDFGEGYIAVIHIDGNDMGKRVLSLPFEQYQNFAVTLAAATQEAAQSATACLVQRDEKRRETRQRLGFSVRDDDPIPACPVVLGGDDCTIITRAEDAIPFASHFLEMFEKQGRQAVFGENGLTATAGIAFIKQRTPFSHGLNLADAICRYAKQCLRHPDSQGGTPSSLLFYRVTTGAFADWNEILGQELAAGPPGGAVRRGGPVFGPYRRDGERSIGQLAELTKALMDLPSGPLREWLRVVSTDTDRSAIRWQ